MSAEHGPGRTLLQLIIAGDPDAAAGFYDARAPSVREYCAELCPTGRVEEATLAAFTDFLGRATSAPVGGQADEMLHASVRVAAARRMDAAGGSPACQAVPELLAARVNGELERDGEPLEQHLSDCRRCREAAERVMRADEAFERPPDAEPSQDIRARWLEMVSSETEVMSEARQPRSPEPEPGSPEPEPATAPTRVRTRRGGLVGAARRFASSARGR